ncbi:helix-turn-helix domain-containing protein [Dermatophilaceae bacterium Soc4.6]
MPTSSVEPHRVVVLALRGVVAFELGLPHRFLRAGELADESQDTTRPPAYDVRMCTVDDGPVLTSAGFEALPTHAGTALASADTIVVPGITRGRLLHTGRMPDDLAALLATARPGVRWVSICTGAWVLAAMGLLDGRRATTHWAHADDFRRLFPTVDLDPDVLWVDHGDVLTSAGNAAGIDLLLHLLRTDHGSEVANRVARGAVVAPWRDGGQAQFIDQPLPPPGDDGTGPTRAWAVDRLAEPLDLTALATHARMSVRTFTRRFREETGESTGAWLARVRVERARHLLETTDLSVDEVASRCGYGTSASLRNQLGAAVGLSPLAYRRTYRRTSA